MKYMCVVVGILLIALTGCAYANPKTELHGGMFGWGFSDGKDNDVTLEEASYDPDTRQFHVKGLNIRNNASDVRIANVQQMEAHAKQIQAFGEVVESFAKVVAALPLPGGGAPVADVNVLVAPPTTQPTEE